MQFYQVHVQAQIKVCGTGYGDFVVWHENKLVIQRIYPDEELISSILSKATEFFKLGILPELLEKWYSRPPALPQSGSTSSTPTSDAPVNSSNSELWCFCRKEELGEMIACDNEYCKIV